MLIKLISYANFYQLQQCAALLNLWAKHTSFTTILHGAGASFNDNDAQLGWIEALTKQEFQVIGLYFLGQVISPLILMLIEPAICQKM